MNEKEYKKCMLKIQFWKTEKEELNEQLYEIEMELNDLRLEAYRYKQAQAPCLYLVANNENGEKEDG